MLEKGVNCSIHFQYKSSIFPFCWRYRLMNAWTDEQVRLGQLIDRHLHLMGISNVYRLLCMWPKEQNHDRTEKKWENVVKAISPFNMQAWLHASSIHGYRGVRSLSESCSAKQLCFSVRWFCKKNWNKKQCVTCASLSIGNHRQDQQKWQLLSTR